MLDWPPCCLTAAAPVRVIPETPATKIAYPVPAVVLVHVRVMAAGVAGTSWLATNACRLFVEVPSSSDRTRVNVRPLAEAVRVPSVVTPETPTKTTRSSPAAGVNENDA